MEIWCLVVFSLCNVEELHSTHSGMWYDYRGCVSNNVLFIKQEASIILTVWLVEHLGFVIIIIIIITVETKVDKEFLTSKFVHSACAHNVYIMLDIMIAYISCGNQLTWLCPTVWQHENSWHFRTISCRGPL